MVRTKVDKFSVRIGTLSRKYDPIIKPYDTIEVEQSKSYKDRVSERSINREIVWREDS